MLIFTSALRENAKISKYDPDPLELPDVITFLSTGSSMEIQDEIDAWAIKTIDGKRKKVRIKSTSSNYIYTSGMNKGQVLPVELSYIQRLKSFNLLSYEFRNTEQAEE